MNATELNVSALAELVGYHVSHKTALAGGLVMPNQIPRTVAVGAHIKRCQKAGLFVVEGKLIRLTPEGANRVLRYIEKFLGSQVGRTFSSTSSTDQLYRANFNALGAAYFALGGDPSKRFIF